MPQRKQLTWTELRVGLFVLVAIFVLVVAIFYVTGAGVLGPKYRLVTYLPETDGLAIGAPVRLDGVEAGNVDAIQMNSTPPLTPARSIKLTLRIDRKYQNEIRTDSSAGLITEGLLGNRYVSIQRGFTGQPLQANQEIPGREEKAIKQIVERGADLVQNLNAMTIEVKEIVEGIQRGRGSLGKILTDDGAYNRLEGTLTKVEQIIAGVQAGEGSLGKLIADEDFYNRANSAVIRLDNMLGDVQAQKGTIGKLLYDPAVYEDARTFLNSGNAVLADVRAGRGTLGKLATDDALFVNLRDASANVNAAAAKLNSNTGSAGRFFTDPNLYDNLTGLTGDMRLLVGDFRREPKKFLRVKFSIF